LPDLQPSPLDLAALACQEPPARHWFRTDWLSTGVTLFAGAGGAGKSGLAQHEATAATLGRAYFAPAPTAYSSLVWNCEDAHDDMWRRQVRICDHEQIEMSSLAGRLHLVSRYGCDNALMAEVTRGQLVSTTLMDELREQVNDLNVDALWLDNVAHLFLGSHDDRTQVTSFINRLNGLVRGRPFAVVLMAHVSRAHGSEYSGSVAWENAARMRWYLGQSLPDQPQHEDSVGQNQHVRFLAKRKSNYSARDHVRFTMQDGLLVPDDVARTSVGGLAAVIDERRAEEICLAGFHTLVAMGIRTTDGKTSPDYLPSQIVAKSLGCGYSKRDIGAAMNRLMTKGVFLRAVVGKHTNRSPKFGLVVKDEEL
jgi:hypothetical protein